MTTYERRATGSERWEPIGPFYVRDSLAKHYEYHAWISEMKKLADGEIVCAGMEEFRQREGER